MTYSLFRASSIDLIDLFFDPFVIIGDLPVVVGDADNLVSLTILIFKFPDDGEFHIHHLEILIYINFIIHTLNI